jgi:hypothetical protein
MGYGYWDYKSEPSTVGGINTIFPTVNGPAFTVGPSYVYGGMILQVLGVI